MFRKILSSILALVIVLAVLHQSLRVSVIYLWYFSNLELITEKYCVNKDEPEKHCNGKCHVKKIIEGTNEKQNKPQIPVFEIKDNVLFICESVRNTFKERYFQRKYLVILNKLSGGYLEAIFRPPISCISLS